MTVENMAEERLAQVLAASGSVSEIMTNAIAVLSNAAPGLPWDSLEAQIARLQFEPDAAAGIELIQQELNVKLSSEFGEQINALYFRCGRLEESEVVEVYGVDLCMELRTAGLYEPDSVSRSAVMTRLQEIYTFWVPEQSPSWVRQFDIAAFYARVILERALQVIPVNTWLGGHRERYLLFGRPGWPKLIGSITENGFQRFELPLRLVKWDRQ